jgi:diguanylate cyclase (GGDEF)-like protein
LDPPQAWGDPNPARTNRVLRTLRAGHRALLRARDERTLLTTMCEALASVGGYAIAWIGFAEHDASRTIVPVAHAGAEGRIVSGLRLSWDASQPSVSGEAIRTGEPVVGRQLASDPVLAKWRRGALRLGYAAVTALPLRGGDEVIGCLTLVSNNEDAFDAMEVALLQELADDVAFGLSSLRTQAREAEARQTIRRMTLRDHVTGLPNRTAARDALGAAIADATPRGATLGVLSIHVARYDEVSDTLGREAGDALLRAIVQRLENVAVPAPERLARIGDDALLLVTEGDAEHATDLARRIADALYPPVERAGLSLDARVAIGIAVHPRHGSDAEELMRRAKVAMDRAGIGGCALYSGPYDDERRRRLALIGELKAAIGAGELMLYCQPKADVASGRICGAEALMRWCHPRDGMIAPSFFVGLAEHAGLTTPLTHWVLEAAFRERSRWHDAHFDQPLAVNVSPRDLHDPKLLDRVRGLIATWGIAPGWMQIEVTESALMEEPDVVIERLAALRDLGIESMIDDYGSGYSSLRYLQQMPVSSIKIDQAFVRRMLSDRESAAIVHSTIELCHTLSLRAIAEGVEDEPTWRALAREGCDAVQGYYVGRPLPVEDFEAWAMASRFRPAASTRMQ